MGFGVRGIQNAKYFHFPYGLMSCFEILNFDFSNTIPRGVSACKILTF